MARHLLSDAGPFLLLAGIVGNTIPVPVWLAGILLAPLIAGGSWMAVTTRDHMVGMDLLREESKSAAAQRREMMGLMATMEVRIARFDERIQQNAALEPRLRAIEQQIVALDAREAANTSRMVDTQTRLVGTLNELRIQLGAIVERVERVIPRSLPGAGR